MIEHGGCVQEHFKEQHAGRWSAYRGDHSKFNKKGKQYLNRMKPSAGGDIHVQIRMVHPMKPPKKRLIMKRPVLRIDHQIKTNHRKYYW